MASLKIMSFNLRVDNTGDGINSFTNRFDRVIEVICREAPDIVGFQEVTDSMRARLRDRIPGYTVQGCGRETTCHGESMLIAYRTDKVELIELENRWLSPTPTVPGSTFGADQSPCPRMFCSALLLCDGATAPIRFINTHLDHWGAEARYLGAMQLVQYISVHPEPCILTGDFNATPDTREVKLFAEALAARGLRDATAGLPGTFHNFGRIPEEQAVKIDYIFTDLPGDPGYRVPDAPVNGQYYSDHNAVCAYVNLP